MPSSNERLVDRLRARAAPIVKPPLRRLRYRLADLADRRRPDEVDGLPLPPPSLRLLNGPDEFLAMGRAIVADIVAHTGLGTGDDVLDAGCGAGRVALALIDVVGPAGTYEGFDVVPEAVAWCTRRITPRHPNFGFRLADVHSHHYHRAGRQRAEDYRFPYDDGSFDVVVLTSVFTHLGAAATERYVRESARVLRRGGRIYASFFLVDDEARAAIDSGRPDLSFVAMDDGALTSNPHDPEAAVAHDLERIRSVLASAGLDMVDGPLMGNWCGRDAPTRLQDVVIAQRVRDPSARA